MKNVLFAVIVKQLIVLPLAPLYNATKFAYAWLNLFLFFQILLLDKYTSSVP